MTRGSRSVLRAAASLAILGATLPTPALGQAYSELSPAVRQYVTESMAMVVIEDVTLIDGTGGPAIENASVVVVDGVIRAAGPTDRMDFDALLEEYLTNEVSIIVGTGHTLIPGLVMLHEHLFYPSGQARYNTNEVSFPPLYLAGGVTTMRTGGSLDPYSDLSTRRLIEEGRQPGPTIDVTGPYLEGPGGFIRSFPQLATPEEAVDHVNFWVDRGVTSFKAYNLITREVLGAAIQAAHARGVKVTGHLCSITYAEAADLGIDNLEHGFFAATDWVEGKVPDTCVGGGDQSYLALDLESREFLDVVDHLIENDVAITSTLNVVERIGANRPMPPTGAQQAIAESLRNRVVQRAASRGTPAGSALLRRYMEMEKIFSDRGGLLVAGTDPTGAGDVVPGYANQRAYQLFLEMGFSPEEAVRILTLNGAIYLEQADRIGTIEEGKIADMVLMEGDLTADPEVIRRMVTVFKDGVGYSSELLFELGTTGTVGIR